MTEPIYAEQKVCRVCAAPLKPVLDMGELYPSAFLAPGEAPPEKAPLVLAQCENCGLIQLQHTVDLDLMYRHYYYQSGINPTMVAALQDVVDQALARVELSPGDVACDIGCNDRTLLAMYPSFVQCIGFDPAQNLPSKRDDIYFVNEYFDASYYDMMLVTRAKIVTSLAMFYDLPDPAAFVRDVAHILHGDGLWVMQISDLHSMFVQNEIENPCHEHLEYYRSRDIQRLVEAEGLEIFRIEHNDVNSGSLRFYIDWKGVRPVESSVQETLDAEEAYFTSEQGSIEAFAARVSEAKRVLVGWLKQEVAAGRKIYGIAASTKGNTLLQYFGIDHTLITAIGDLNREKFGKVTVGTNIPIISEAEVLAAKPDYLLILSWHFLDFFLKTFKPYMDEGGAVVSPLPDPCLYFAWEGGETDREPLSSLLDSSV